MGDPGANAGVRKVRIGEADVVANADSFVKAAGMYEGSSAYFADSTFQEALKETGDSNPWEYHSFPREDYDGEIISEEVYAGHKKFDSPNGDEHHIVSCPGLSSCKHGRGMERAQRLYIRKNMMKKFGDKDFPRVAHG